MTTWQKRERTLSNGTIESWEELDLGNGEVIRRYPEEGHIRISTTQPMTVKKGA